MWNNKNKAITFSVDDGVVVYLRVGGGADDVVELNPDWVSICIGINDVWRQFDCPAMTNTHVYPDEYRENMEKMNKL